MRSVGELLPTEAFLLLNPNASGEELLYITLRELVYLKFVRVRTTLVGGHSLSTFHLRETSDSSFQPKEYQETVLRAIRDHYRFHSEITLENALTARTLIEIILAKFDISYSQFKFDHIYFRLAIWNLVRPRFPFYYFGVALTKAGKDLRDQLVELMESYRKKTEEPPADLKLVKDRLGPNVILCHLSPIKSPGSKWRKPSKEEYSDVANEVLYADVVFPRHATPTDSADDDIDMDFD